MIFATGSESGWINFTGGGREMLEFSACVNRNVKKEYIRQGRGFISIPDTSIIAVMGCVSALGIDVSQFSQVINIFQQHEEARKKAMKIIAEKDDTFQIPSKWRFLETHQKIAVNVLTQEGLLGACLFDEQGTGKTLATLAAFDVLKEKGWIDFMMVIAPLSVLNSWRDDTQKTDYEISIVTGTREQKENLIRGRTNIVALNYDTLGAMLPVAKAVARREKCLLVVDEAFAIKNPKAKRSQAVRELRKECGRAFVLSGTPAPRGPEDVIHQSDIADNGYAFQGYQSTGDRIQDAESVYEVLSSRSIFLRRTKRDVLPMLPPKDIRIIDVSLSGRQEEMYLSAKDDMVLYLKNMNNKTFKSSLVNYFSRRAKLLQLCGCPSMVDELFPNDHAKVKKLDEFVNDIVIKDNKKLVIWTSYKKSINELRDRYQEHGLVLMHGESSDREREDAIYNFQKDPSIKIFLGNPATAGAGITLHAASDSIYVSYPDRAAEFIQSIDRIHRIGQTADVVRYYFLVCRNTLEVNQIRLLHQKILSQHLIFGERSEWPSSIEEALEELSYE